MTDDRLERPEPEPSRGGGSTTSDRAGVPEAAPAAQLPPPATTVERQPPPMPPSPPTIGEPGPPGSGPPVARRRGRDHGGIPILGIVLVLLGLGLLVERAVPGVSLGDVWPYGAVALGLLLVAASIRVGDAGGG